MQIHILHEKVGTQRVILFLLNSDANLIRNIFSTSKSKQKNNFALLLVFFVFEKLPVRISKKRRALSI